MLHKKIQSGFTVLELLLGLAVIAILAVSATLYLRGSIVEVSLETTIKNFVSDINMARGRSMAGDRGLSYGVRAVSGTADTQGSWELFATNTSFIASDAFDKETEYLPSGVKWNVPSSGSMEVIFTPLSGYASNTSFEISYNQSVFKINITNKGEISTTRL